MGVNALSYHLEILNVLFLCPCVLSMKSSETMEHEGLGTSLQWQPLYCLLISLRWVLGYLLPAFAKVRTLGSWEGLYSPHEYPVPEGA